MKVDVLSCISEAKSDQFINKTVIVIDVLRATSSIISALKHGSSGVIPVETVQQAKSTQEKDDLLGGERYCKKIPGFDLGNSPTEYSKASIQNKRIIMTTTNGIRAIQKSNKATHIIAGAIINATSCAKVALALDREMVIVCAGTQDQFSLEDGLGAGVIIDELIKYKKGVPILLNDFGTAMHALYLHSQDQLQEAISQCSNGKKLKQL